MDAVIIYRLGSLGDTVIALPFFNRIATMFPSSRRIVLTNHEVSRKAPHLMSVLGSSSLVHGAISYSVGTRKIGRLLRLRREIRATGARTLIYMTAPRGTLAGLRDLLFFKACGIRRIIGAPIGASVKLRVNASTGEVEPEVERLARALAELGMINLLDPKNWNLWLDAQETTRGEAILESLLERPILAFHLGGKDLKKDWGQENWLALFETLAPRFSEWGLLGTGSEEDASRVNEALSRWRGPVVNACGRLSPRETAAALRKARLFVGHDSGPMHLASAVGTSCVALFGDNNQPRMWHPYIGRNYVLHDMSGVRNISVAAVADAVLRLSTEEKGSAVREQIYE